MDIVFLIGRILVGGYFLFNASNHFFGTAGLAGYAASKGVPQPRLAVLGSGLLLLVAGLSFLTGWYPLAGASAAVLFFIPVNLIMHAFWKVNDPMARMSEMVNFTKNTALLGSALMFLAIPAPWPLGV